MTQIIGGHNLGLFDGSFTKLNRNDKTGLGTMGHGEETYANVSNGNLVFQERDVYLPSFGEDFNFVRTYNSRGVPSDSKGWTFSPNVTLDKHTDHPLPAGSKDVTDYTVTYADGTALEFVYNGGRWISTDGAGAFETLQVATNNKDLVQYTVTRADRSVYRFDKDSKLLSVTDSNGVATTFDYKGNDVIAIHDDTGHLLTLNYTGGRLTSVTEKINNVVTVLVQYAYTNNMLTQVTDRYGLVTTYHYNSDKLLDSITLPSTQTVGNITTTYATRTVSFTYAKVHWDDHPHHETAFDGGDEFVVTSITDANGGVTTFEYNFLFDKTIAANDRDAVFKPNGGNDFQGGTTRVVDALGNARAYSNAAIYVQWRIDNGFYRSVNPLLDGMYNPNYNPKTQSAQIKAQNDAAEVIRSRQAVTYTYDPNGQITRVKDELGAETAYTYDVDGNLTSITSANGFRVANSNDAYYRALRAELGPQYRDSSGNGKLVADLSDADKAALLESYTSRFSYDSNGNMLTSKDYAGNVTTFEYTSFNQVQKATSAMGHITRYEYDGHQNLVKRTDPMGNITAFVYDANNGNLLQKIVYLDKTDLSTPALQQVTRYSYDQFGNNTVVEDALGFQTINTFDSFGNLTSSKDPLLGVTNYAYDGDNRMLTLSDPEGHTTSFAYDSVGNQISVTDANGHVVTRVFDPNNMLMSTIDAVADSTKSRTTSAKYDVLGDATQTTDGELRTTTYRFDAHRQLVRIDTALVKTANDADISYNQTFAYDGQSNIITQTDRNGNTTQYLFNQNGMIRRVTDANLNVTQYSYDADTRQIEVLIGAQLLVGQRKLTFTYYDDDKLRRESDGIGTIHDYAYDQAGNVQSVTNANTGDITTYTYDLDNQLRIETRPAVNNVNGVSTVYTVTHTYDQNGNEVTTKDENNMVTSAAYDRDNRLVMVTANQITTVFAYDSRDNRTSVSIGVTAHMEDRHVVIDSAAQARVTTYVYDDFNQVTAKIDGLGNALATSDDAIYRKMRSDMHEEPVLALLSDAAKGRLRALFTDNYQYDRVGNLVQVTDHLGRNQVSVYDALNRVVTLTEGAGNLVRTTNYRYDGNDNLVLTSAPGGRSSTANYDAMDRVTYQTDAGSVVTKNEYDQLGNLVKQTRAYNSGADRVTTFEYDERGRMTAEHSPIVHTSVGGDVSVTTKFTYDGEDHLKSRISAFGLAEERTESFEYDASGRLTAQVNGAGERTEFAYDGVGNRVRTTVAPGLAEQKVNKFEYDAGGRLTAEIDGQLVRTEYVYDSAGNKVEIIQAAGTADVRHTLLTYDADNQLVSVVDPIGWARTYSDATEFQTWRTTHGKAQTAAGVLTANQTSAIQDTRRTSYEYDQLGNQTKITDADGTVTANTFNEMGWLATQIVGVGTAHGGIKTTNTYDLFGNVLTSTQAWATDSSGVSRTTTYKYDALDRQTRITDGEGFSTVFEYDAFGNTTHIQRGAYLVTVNPDAAKVTAAAHPFNTTLTFDAMDRLLSTTDGRGNVVQNTYDALGNRIVQTSGLKTLAGLDVAHMSELTFKYDLAGRMTERDSPTGGQVKLTYDKAGNLTKQETLQRAPAGGAEVWSTQNFAYDKNGRLTDSYDAASTHTQYAFDRVGNQTGIVYAVGTSDQRSVGFQFDLADEKIADIDGYGNMTLYSYDAVGNMTKKTDALNHVTRYYYDAFHQMSGKLEERSAAAAYYTSYEHDAAGNLTQTRVYMTAIAPLASDATPLVPVADSVHDRITTSVYDAANRITGKTAPDGSSKVYEYDSTDKLVRQTQYGSPDAGMVGRTALATARVLTWEYDESGRVKKFTNVDGVTETYAYDAANNKTSEIVHNGTMLASGFADPDRTTTYDYDADNRTTIQTFDPSGLDLTQTLAYDLAGDAISKTDSNGNVTNSEYDLENRIVKVTDPLGHYLTYGYDRVGNLTSVSDANRNTITRQYDLNNRVLHEIHALVQVKHWVLGVLVTENVSPTTTTAYDAVGNAVQITDARGNVTTRWFDGAGNIIGERNADGALRLFTYDAANSLLAATLDMQSHTGEVINLSTLPAVGLQNNTRVATNTYDLGGRVIRTDYSAIDVTTVNYAAGTSTTQSLAPYEQNKYDAFGNLVESVDRNGKSSYAYFDLRGRRVAMVDAAGYLVETSYDDQDNVVEQRRYKTVLGAHTALTRPAAPDAAPVTVDRIFDAAGRMTDQISPPVHTLTGEVRVVTHFTYDGVGNMTSRTLGYATINSSSVTMPGASPRAEYYFYDAAGRRRAVVGADRVLNVFDYDAKGNLTSQKRFANTVGTTFNLATASLAAVLDPLQTGATENLARDEATTYAYDLADRLITKTDLMGSGTADDLAEVSGYDENGNRTYGLNADGYATSTRFDASGQVIETITPNGSHSHIEYDTGGLKTAAWVTGATGISAPIATSLGAHVANVSTAPLTITWHQDGGAGMTSWVAWDTSPRAGDPPSPAPGVAGVAGVGYAHATGPTVGTGNLSTAIALPAGTSTIYFRVMSLDSFGNLAWSPEQSVFVPTRIQSMSIGQSGDKFTATIVFDAAVTSADLKLSDLGQPPIYSQPSDYTASSADGGITWNFVFSGTSAKQYRVEWVKDGTTYHTNDIALLAPPGIHADATGGWVTWPVPRDSTAAVGNGQFILLNGLLQPAASSLRTITGQLNFQPGITTTSTTATYDVFYGTVSAETHDASVAYRQNYVATPTDNGGSPKHWTYSWAASGSQSTFVKVSLNSAETPRVPAGSMKVSYRTVTGTTLGDFTDTVATKSTNDFTASLSLTANSTYDVKVWYTDAGGHEVIVEWRRITTPATVAVDTALPAAVDNDTQPGNVNGSGEELVTFTDNKHSLQVLASETGGKIATGASGSALTVTVGTYVGPVDPGASTLLLTPVLTTDSVGAARASDGSLSVTYFTRIEYNALGIKIATNEDSGLWRRLGVDANGNTVETDLYGTQAADTAYHAATPDSTKAPIVSFKQYDARNLEVVSYGAVPGAGLARAVTTTTYDYASQVVKVVDPGNGVGNGRNFTFDNVGNKIRSTDAAGNLTTMSYSIFGELVSQVDANLNDHRKDYDAAGRLIKEYVQFQTDSNRYYAYDSFGRRVQVGRGNGTVAANGTVSGDVTTLAAAYDQRDRLVSLTDGKAGVTHYMYDGRDNLIWTQDALLHWYGTAYDGMGQVIHQYSFQTHWSDASGNHTGTAPVTFLNVLTALTPGDTTYRPTLDDIATTYDAFDNKISETDAAGRVRSFSYAAFGRLGSSVTGDLTTTYAYDRFGNKTAEGSSYGKNITYAYDNAARLTTINDVGISTSTAYTYDAAGRRLTEVLTKGVDTLHSYAYAYNANGWTTSWRDNATGIGIGEIIAYDGVGNVTSVKGLKSGSTEAAPLFEHTYAYDVFDRVTSGAGDTFAYDARGRRHTFTHGGTTTTYTYDNNDQVKTAVAGTETVTWTYDAAGNITNITNNAATPKIATYTYDTNNVSYVAVDGSTTTTYFDKGGRVLTTSTLSAGNTYSYVHAYNGDGTEKSVTASGTGGVTGSSTSTYDVDGNLTHVSLGQGDDANAITSKDFIYDNQGHIIKATLGAVVTSYLYANDQPVGEYPTATPGSPLLDAGIYSVIRNVPGAYGASAPDFPATSVNEHVVAAGETLQAIAGAVYGHPELWYLIADANGLSGSEHLTAGMRLTIPNSVQYVGNTSSTHALYNAGEIIGSKLPNLKSPPPPPKDNCAVIGAIIAIVVVTLIAVVATVLTAGALGPAAFLAVAGTYGAVAGVIAGVLVAAAVGAAIAFAASALTQVILVESGLQESFDWNAVAADTAAGAFSGAAVGLGAIVGVAAKVTTLLRVASVVAQTALEVGGEVTRQVVVSGHVNDWTGVAIAGGAAALGGVGDLAENVAKTNAAASKAVKAERAAAELAKNVDEGLAGLDEAARASKIAADAADASLEARLATKSNGFERLGKAAARLVDPFGGTARRAKGIAQHADELADAIRAGSQSLDAVESTAKTAGRIAFVAKRSAQALTVGNAAWQYFDKDRAAVVGRTSSFRFGAAGAAGTITGAGRVLNAVLQAVNNTNRAVAAPPVATRSKSVADASRAAQSGFVDSPSVAAYALDHKRQHQWVPTSWIDAASSSITQIQSQFPGVPPIGMTLGYNRLLSGETARFDHGAIAGVAASTVGHVGTNQVPLPIIVLNNQAPSPFG